MMSVVQSGSLCGVEALGVRVEASPIRGLPGFDIVGLPEAGIRESRVRVLAALRNCGFELPEKRFVVNLAPADLRKSGSSFDLGIAIALLAQCGLCAPNRLDETLIIGELSLDGQIRPVRGLLAHLRSARQRGLRAALIPEADSSWANLVEGMQIFCASHLNQAVAFLGGEQRLAGPPPRPALTTAGADVDLRDVRGQQAAKRALEVAAAGNHDLLMIGPPGAGKTMLARRLPGLLPPPTPDEALEIATIASAGGLRTELSLGSERPFRAPHHSCSDAALVGGGDPIRPGEVTLAHGGVLFLDELPEFRRGALEGLRPTMESGVAVIVRARDRACMPAKPLVVAAMNPCVCGYRSWGRVANQCRSPSNRTRPRSAGSERSPVLIRNLPDQRSRHLRRSQRLPLGQAARSLRRGRGKALCGLNQEHPDGGEDAGSGDGDRGGVGANRRDVVRWQFTALLLGLSPSDEPQQPRSFGCEGVLGQPPLDLWHIRAALNEGYDVCVILNAFSLQLHHEEQLDGHDRTLHALSALDLQ
jgi:magnesium chelatase family protein